MDDDAIRTLVIRLARPHASGGDVISRAAILAEGADFDAVTRWITAHDGTAEIAEPAAPRGGLHGSRVTDSSGAQSAQKPRRFVLPPGALN